MQVEIPEFLNRLWRRLRKFPTAYTLGPLLFALGCGLLLLSLTIETGIVGLGSELGDAPPGIAERNVSFPAAPLFQATLVAGACGVEFHLLNDSAYQAFETDGSLPAPTLDCSRTKATVEGRVGHLVTNYSALPGTPNATFAISFVFLGPRAPYALLSIPGAGLALAVTIWVSMTIMARGTDRLRAEARLKYEKRMKK